MLDIKAGCCQFAIEPGKAQNNFDTVKRMLSGLAAENCRLAVLPEMWPCSFSYLVLNDVARRAPEILDKMREIAAGGNMLIAGSLPEIENGVIYNTSYLIDSTGEIAGSYRKVHLFSPYGEHRHFGGGKSAHVFSTSIGKIGLMICYDLRFPELARKLALDGAEIICVSALWPDARIENWLLLLRARATENQLFVVGCNGCGTEKRITWGGTSAIASPTGAVLAQAGTGEQSIVAELKEREMREFREMMPCFEDRVPEAYGPM